MTTRIPLGLICAGLLTLPSTILAQTARPAQPTAPAPAAPTIESRMREAAPPRKPGQLVNIRIEFTINESRSGTTPTKRTVSLIVADGENGSVRSEPSAFQVPGVLQLNVDARPDIVAGDKIRLFFSLQYTNPGNVATDAPRGTILTTNLRESLSLILENGTPLLVAQSADPTSDRTVTVEVKAAVLR